MLAPMVRRLILICAIAASACGGGSPSTPTNPDPSNPNTFTLTSSGVSPSAAVTYSGSRELFVNRDSRRHYMASDEHPDHLLCPALNSVGVLNPGESRESANLVESRTCGFHDHDNPPPTTELGNIWTGRVVIR